MKIYQAVQKLLVGDTQTAMSGLPRSPLIPLKQYRISSKSTNQFKRCTHLRSLNVRHYEVVEASGLKDMAS
jgi:hypothetical protein